MREDSSGASVVNGAREREREWRELGECRERESGVREARVSGAREWVSVSGGESSRASVVSRARERGGVGEKVGRESGRSEARERREFGEKELGKWGEREWLDICEIGVGELSEWMNKRERMISVASILGYSIQQGSEMRGLSKRV